MNTPAPASGDSSAVTLHACQVVTYIAVDRPGMRCGRSGSWFAVRDGEGFWVCPEHRRQFEATQSGSSAVQS